jgi:hypothetical protein
MQSLFSTYSKIDNPTWEMILFTFILSFLLSGLVAFTYEKTTHNTVKNYGLIQVFILSSMISTMILQAIGDNAAAGLGMLGALHVVQFRTTIKNLRDTVFMFACLGCGIACGLYGFFIAVMGCLLFCLFAFLVRYSPFHFSHLITWRISLRSDEITGQTDDFSFVMNEYCHFWTLESYSAEPKKDPLSTAPPKFMYQYTLLFKDEDKQRMFVQALSYMEIETVALKKRNEK